MSAHAPLSTDVLRIDTAGETERISQAIRKMIFGDLKRKGAVIGISGGIDSSVVAALSIRALGPDRVLGLLLPEVESSPESLRLGHLLAESLGAKTLVEDVTNLLESAGCYQRRDEAIRTLMPDYGPGYKSKIVLSSPLKENAYKIFSVVVQSPDGTQTKARLSPEAYSGIIAATNFKQRVRKMMEYYHADRLHYAVVGTANRLEYDQGFFVKSGDGSADLKPIAHLYKSQVYQLASYLNIPDEIRRRPPTTDTYSLEQTQEEFYFSLPHEKLDLCLYGKNHGMPPSEVSRAAGLRPEQVEQVYRDIDSKRSALRYLHMRPLLVEEIPEISS